MGQKDMEDMPRGQILGKVNGKVIMERAGRTCSQSSSPKGKEKVPGTSRMPVANGGRHGGHGISGNRTGTLKTSILPGSREKEKVRKEEVKEKKAPEGSIGGYDR